MKSILSMMLALTALFTKAQNATKENSPFAGTWKLVTVKSIAADSSVSYPYGEDPGGSMILTATGNYSIQIYRSARARIASGNKTTATPDENAMLVKGSNAHFGIYEHDRVNSSILFKVAHAFFSNWEGTTLKQQYTLKGNEIIFTSSVSTFGGTAVVVWEKE